MIESTDRISELRNIRVMLWGFGAMGSGIARMIMSKKGIELVGVADQNPQLIGQDIYELLQVRRAERPIVKISADGYEMIEQDACDLVILATDSFTAQAFPKIKHCLECNIAVISTAEEMAYPAAAEPELAAELDRLASEHGVAVLGTGINPGFVLDYLILALSGTCPAVESITASRINDLSPFGRAVMEEQGVGLTADEFSARVETDDLAGHVGFPESIALLVEGLGLTIERIEQTKEPIVSRVKRQAPHAQIDAGEVAGIRQRAVAYDSDGQAVIDLVHPQQICPEAEGVSTGDFITIETGGQALNLAIKPEIPGGSGTIAMVVNMIPLVLCAAPGLRTMLELPPPRAIMGDFRAQLSTPPARLIRRRKGDYVVIRRTVLNADERAPQVPADTASTDLNLWLKGFLLHDAYPGDSVEIETVIGRRVSGRLTALPTVHTHGFGEDLPELLAIGRQIRASVAQVVRPRHHDAATTEEVGGGGQ